MKTGLGKAVVVLIFIAIPLAAIIYLFSTGRILEAIATWGVSSVLIWFMLRFIERQKSRNSGDTD